MPLPTDSLEWALQLVFLALPIGVTYAFTWRMPAGFRGYVATVLGITVQCALEGLVARHVISLLRNVAMLAPLHRAFRQMEDRFPDMLVGAWVGAQWGLLVGLFFGLGHVKEWFHGKYPIRRRFGILVIMLTCCFPWAGPIRGGSELVGEVIYGSPIPLVRKHWHHWVAYESDRRTQLFTIRGPVQADILPGLWLCIATTYLLLFFVWPRTPTPPDAPAAIPENPPSPATSSPPPAA